MNHSLFWHIDFYKVIQHNNSNVVYLFMVCGMFEFHQEFFSSACLAVGSVLQLVDKVMTSQLRNGFSINRSRGICSSQTFEYSVFSVYIYLFIDLFGSLLFSCTRRPPGHHAHADKMNGFCMFNNLAIAARYAQKQHGVNRWESAFSFTLNTFIYTFY